MEDDLWYASYQSRKLKDFRRDIAGLWDDQAAKDLNLRYFHPHEQDDQDMLQAWQQQQQSLQQCRARISSAQEHVLAIEALLMEVVELLQQAQKEIDSAHAEWNQFMEYEAKVGENLSRVSELISQANAVCQGVPTS